MEISRQSAVVIWLVAFSSTWLPFIASSRVVKRSDDPNPLEAVVSQLSQEVTTLKAELQALKNIGAKRAAIHATLSTNITVHSPIHFNVLHEVGGGYDRLSGMYRVPHSGWYSVHVQLFPMRANMINVDLVQNNVVVARARCDNQPDCTCAASVVLHLQAGDRFWLQTDFPGPYNGAGFDNLFSAILVTPDP